MDTLELAISPVFNIGPCITDLAKKKLGAWIDAVNYDIERICLQLNADPKKAIVAGGAIRDMLLVSDYCNWQYEPNDIDIFIPIGQDCKEYSLADQLSDLNTATIKQNDIMHKPSTISTPSKHLLSKIKYSSVGYISAIYDIGQAFNAFINTQLIFVSGDTTTEVLERFDIGVCAASMRLADFTEFLKVIATQSSPSISFNQYADLPIKILHPESIREHAINKDELTVGSIAFDTYNPDISDLNITDITVEITKVALLNVPTPMRTLRRLLQLHHRFKWAWLFPSRQIISMIMNHAFEDGPYAESLGAETARMINADIYRTGNRMPKLSSRGIINNSRTVPIEDCLDEQQAEELPETRNPCLDIPF